MRIGLRLFLAVSFAIGSMVPLGIWAVWVGQSAFDKEIAEVEDRHLLLARNLSRALDRYAEDAAAVFSHVTSTEIGSNTSEHLSELLDSLGFRHICIVEADTQRVLSVAASSLVGDLGVSLPSLDHMIEIAQNGFGDLIFTDVQPGPYGDPAIYLLREVSPNIIAIGELGTEYLQTTQQAVVFGEGGHAAIVDASGNVLGHPRPEWVVEIKNISQVDAVARMMRGETGVSQFFSPAANKDMIAGFTSVPTTGWGVMIPQPLEELEQAAASVGQSALLIAGVLALVCGLIGWIVGGFVTRPIEAVKTAADRLGEGDSNVLVPVQQDVFTPNELVELSKRFNEMSSAVEDSRRLQRVALRTAEDAAEAKASFLARVTHELRTPLNSIIGFSGMIRDQSLGPIQQPDYVEYGGLIHSSGGRLLELVNDIISFVHIQGRTETLSETPVPLAVLLASVGEHCRSAAEAKQLRYSITQSTTLPDVVVDEPKIRQALTHLVTNAIKFTPEGGQVDVAAELADSGEIVITVSDTGIGMAVEDIPTALRPFGQVSDTLKRSHEGAGLGLPLANLLTEMHDGYLVVESQAGQGTTIKVFLPANRVGRPSR